MNAPHKSTVNFELQVSDLAAIIDGITLEQLCEGVRSRDYPDRVGHYQYTHSGRIFFPCDPRPEEVFIKDLVRGMTVARFNNQTKRPFTVLEHSWHTSFIGPRETALERLMHDSPEGLIGDLIRPMKGIPIFGAIYLKVEHKIATAVAKRYKLVYPWTPDIRHADEAVVNAEVAHNVDQTHGQNYLSDASCGIANVDFQYWSPELAEKMFLDRFAELAEERGLTKGRSLEGL